MRQEGAVMKPGHKDLEAWARSDLDVMEDSQGNTIVKGLTLVEVKGGVGNRQRTGTSSTSPTTSAGHIQDKSRDDLVLLVWQ